MRRWMFPQPVSNLSRRALLAQCCLAAAGLAIPDCFSQARPAAPVVNDVTGMNPVPVARLVRPYAAAVDSSFGFWFVCRPDRLREPKIAAFRDWIMEEAR